MSWRDRTRRGRVRSRLTYAGVSFASERRVAECGTDAGARQVIVDRKRSVSKNVLRNLSVNDQTLLRGASGRSSGASGPNLSVRAIES